MGSAKKLYKDVMCCVCGERPAKIKWMCQRCYQKTYRIKHNINNQIIPKKIERSEKTDKIIEEYKKGDKTKSEIARKYGVSRQWINYVIKREMEK